MRVIVLDIEAVPDTSIWTPGPPADAVFRGGVAGGPAFTGTISDQRDHFYPPHAQHVIALGFVIFDVGPLVSSPARTLKVGAIEADEPGILSKFADGQNGGNPMTVVTWNGRHFDLPTIVLRSMHHGIPCAWYYAGRDNRYRFSEDGHCDLADCMADYGAAPRLNLDGMAKLIGLPGKIGDIHGSNVAAAFEAGRLAEITAYCIADAVQTAFLWLRWQWHTGKQDRAEYLAGARGLLAACETDERLREFCARVDRPRLLLGEA